MKVYTRDRYTIYGLCRVERLAQKLLVWAFTQRRLLKNKLCAILLILLTLPVAFLDGDATATIFMALIAVPMFFAKEAWIY